MKRQAGGDEVNGSVEIVYSCEWLLRRWNLMLLPYQMISFDGRCDGDYFRGEILPGGVDTQIIIRISHQNYRLVI